MRASARSCSPRPKRALAASSLTSIDCSRKSAVPGRASRAVSARSKAATASAFRSEEHTSELQSLMRISYAVFCLKKKTTTHNKNKQAKHIHSNINKHEHI